MKIIFFMCLLFLQVYTYSQKLHINSGDFPGNLDLLTDDKNHPQLEINNQNKTNLLNRIKSDHYKTIPLNWENIFGWSNVSDIHNVWAISLESEPKFILIGTAMYTEGMANEYYEHWNNLNWYWDGGILFFKNDSGNPDLVYDSLSVFYGGGWATASGNFNGDDYPDIVYSLSGNSYSFIHYGGYGMNVKPDMKLSDQGFYLANAGDTNGDGFEELISTQNWQNDTVNLYSGSVTGIDENQKLQITAPLGYGSFGFGHAISEKPGDINGDGFSDVVIGAASGYFCIYFGKSGGVESQPDNIFEFPNSTFGAYLTASVVGDVNNDGFDDIAVSYSDTTKSATINFYLFYGSAAGLNSDSIKIFNLTTNSTAGNFTASIGKCGDINGDFIDDLLIGNQWYESGKGQAYIFFGSSSGPGSIPDQIINSISTIQNTRFGADLGEIGDFNYDGYNDVIIGSTYEDKAYIYFGGISGVSGNPDLTLSEGKYFGWSLSKVGNVLGDGKNYILAVEEFGLPYLITLSTDAVPVELTNFNAKVKNNFIELNWTTSSENNNTGFEIYKKESGVRRKESDWQMIGFIPGNGTTTEEKSYTFTDENVLESGSYTYKLKQIDYDGTFEFSKIIEIYINFSSLDYTLYQNYPNPFNPATNIKYDIPTESIVILYIYNSLGEKIHEQKEGIKPGGTYSIKWQPEDQVSGIYYYTISAESTDGNNIFNKTNKMIFLK